MDFLKFLDIEGAIGYFSLLELIFEVFFLNDSY
jgi:hypothetical protein